MSTGGFERAHMSISQGRLNGSTIMRRGHAVHWCCFYSRWAGLGPRHCSSCDWLNKVLAMVAYSLLHELVFHAITGNTKLTRHNIDSHFSSRELLFSKNNIIFKSTVFGPQRTLTLCIYELFCDAWYDTGYSLSLAQKKAPI